MRQTTEVARERRSHRRLVGLQWAAGLVVAIGLGTLWRIRTAARRPDYPLKAIVVCSPANPTGKAMTREELELVASVCQELDLLCISDEVYEHFVLHEGDGSDFLPEARAVMRDGKGLDLRLRLPDGIEGLEAQVRADLSRAVSRGNVTLNLKLTRDTGTGEGLRVNHAVLRAVLGALATVEQAAMETGVTLRQASAADVVSLRGVLEQGNDEADTAPLRAALLADLPGLIAAFNTMRAAEGAQLAALITGQLDRIAALVAEAQARLPERASTQARALEQGLARIMAQADSVDPARLAQELALLAVKSDVTEELDRLTAHLTAARALLSEGCAVGRKLDFLTQEFLREANTLCSKAGDATLTRIGLDLKTVIDQMREQIQNVE